MYVDNCFTIEKIFVQPEQNGTAASETDMDNGPIFIKNQSFGKSSTQLQRKPIYVDVEV